MNHTQVNLMNTPKASATREQKSRRTRRHDFFPNELMVPHGRAPYNDNLFAAQVFNESVQ